MPRSAALSAPAGSFTDAADGVFARALDARDPRFDGVFFVGIVTTGIYCRPVCPARVSDHCRRRFFASAAAAERAGFRPCLRCRPELAPGRALVDAVPRLARAAAQRIAAGALNGRGVPALAAELGVSERHLRRALEREIGVSPLELAQTHRLLLAKQLLADTALPVTQVAYASGFQSLRRFNAAFRSQYRMPPSAVRRAPVPLAAPARATAPNGSGLTSGAIAGAASLRLTLAYRAPFAWDTLLATLRRDAVAGVEMVGGGRYARTIAVAGRSGVVVVENGPAAPAAGAGAPDRRPPRLTPPHVVVHVSAGLVPVLMPLLARLRQLLDLDAEPGVIGEHLAEGGLASLVTRRPGIRVPGAVDGFDAAARAILRRHSAQVAAALGTPTESGVPALARLMPSAEQVAAAGVARLETLGVPRPRAEALSAVARHVADGALRLEPGSNVLATRRALAAVAGLGERTATTIVTRALDWPDAFPATDPALWRAAGVTSARALLARAERWRPWRAYAALHLRLGCAHAAGQPTRDAV